MTNKIKIHNVVEGCLILESKTEFDKDLSRRRDDYETYFDEVKQDGDEIRSWSWVMGPLFGRGGLCLFRDDKPLYYCMTWIS